MAAVLGPGRMLAQEMPRPRTGWAQHYIRGKTDEDEKTQSPQIRRILYVIKKVAVAETFMNRLASSYKVTWRIGVRNTSPKALLPEREAKYAMKKLEDRQRGSSFDRAACCVGFGSAALVLHPWPVCASACVRQMHS